MAKQLENHCPTPPLSWPQPSSKCRDILQPEGECGLSTRTDLVQRVENTDVILAQEQHSRGLYGVQTSKRGI